VRYVILPFNNKRGGALTDVRLVCGVAGLAAPAAWHVVKSNCSTNSVRHPS